MRPRYSAAERYRLDDATIEKISQLVEAGNYINVACAAVGVHRQTYQAWRNAGERVSGHLELSDQEIDPEEYPEDIFPAGVEPEEWQCYKLFWLLEVSEAKAESMAVLAVRKHFPEQWTAAMTLLERRWPQRWRKQQTLEAVHVPGPQLDEQQLISDPTAAALMHTALRQVARGELTAGDDEVTDPDVVPALDSDILTGTGDSSK